MPIRPLNTFTKMKEASSLHTYSIFNLMNRRIVQVAIILNLFKKNF